MAEETQVQEQQELSEDNVIFVGKKPKMSYVLAAVTQFGEGAEHIRVKARGQAISRAVDVAEIVRNKFMKDVHISNVNIDTDEVDTEEGTPLNVSSIEIDLTK